LTDYFSKKDCTASREFSKHILRNQCRSGSKPEEIGCEVMKQEILIETWRSTPL